jgi:hypothetical protein
VRDTRTQNLSDDVSSNCLWSKTHALNNLTPGGMLEELVWEPNLGERGIDLSFSQILTDARSNSANLDTVFDGDDEAVLGAQL